MGHVAYVIPSLWLSSATGWWRRGINRPLFRPKVRHFRLSNIKMPLYRRTGYPRRRTTRSIGYGRLRTYRRPLIRRRTIRRRRY